MVPVSEHPKGPQQTGVHSFKYFLYAISLFYAHPAFLHIQLWRKDFFFLQKYVFIPFGHASL